MKQREELLKEAINSLRKNSLCQSDVIKIIQCNGGSKQQGMRVFNGMKASFNKFCEENKLLKDAYGNSIPKRIANIYLSTFDITLEGFQSELDGLEKERT